MNFKTPFKVLTTAALIGTLSLSAIAPGAASAASTTTQSVKAKTADHAVDYLVLVNSKGELVKLSFDNYSALEVKGEAALFAAFGDFQIKYIVTGNGNVYDLNDFAAAEIAAQGKDVTALDLLKGLDDKDAELDAKVIDDAKETKLEDGKIVVEETPAEVDFEVTEIAAITKTTVKVSFPALKAAVENPVFTVTDGEGKEVAVKEIKLIDADETEATLTFVTPLTEEPTGKWKVNGVEFDTDAVAAAKAVTSAKTEVALLAALQSPYFTDVNEELVTGYKAAVDALEEDATVEEIQAAIDAENKKGNETTVVEAVNEAKNQVELLKALQNGGFERVNADLIAGYATLGYAEDTTPATPATYTTAETVEEIQAIIDEVNYAAAEALVEAADTTSATALTTAAIAKAQTAVTALPEKTDAEKADKKVLQDRLDLANAVAKVKAADSQASLLKALKEPVLGLENIDDKLAKYYKAEFDEEKADIVDTTATTKSVLQDDIIDAGKDAAIDALEDKISKTTDKTTVADLKADLTELKRLDAANFKADGVEVKIIDALVEDYRTALVGTEEASNKNTTALIAAIVDAANDPSVAIDAVNFAAGKTLTDITEEQDEQAAINAIAPDQSADSLLKALKSKTLNLKNVVDANKEAYFSEIVNKSDVQYFTKVTTPEEAQKVVTVTNAYVEANKSTTVEDFSKKLTVFAVAADELGGVNEAKDIINLSSASKLEVAKIYLDTKAADSAKYVTAYQFADALNKAMQVQVNFLADVNGKTVDGDDVTYTVPTTNEMKSILDDEKAFPEFAALESATDKVEAAEKVVNKLTELRAADKAPAVSTFKTIAEVKAAAGL